MTTLQKYLTARELQRDLRVSLQTIRRWRREADFPCLKLGPGRKAPLRFDPDAVDAWLRGWNRKTDHHSAPTRPAHER